MKLLIPLLFLASCGSIEPIQVHRERLILIEIRTQYRHPVTIYHAVWQDRRGIEYVEEVTDTTAFKVGKNYIQLLKR